MVFPFLFFSGSFYLSWVFSRDISVISILILLYLENIFCMFSVLLYLLRLVLWPRISSVLVNTLCALEKNVHSAIVGWCVLSMSIRSSRSTIFYVLSLLCTVSLLIFLPTWSISYWERHIKIFDSKYGFFFFPLIVPSYFASCVLKPCY